MGLGITLRRHLPGGQPWETKGTLWSLVDALGLSLDRLRDYLLGVAINSRPKTAVETLADWCADLSVVFDSTQSLARMQTRLNGQITALGGQSAGYLQAQIQKELPNIVIVQVLLHPASRLGVGHCGIATCNGSTGLPGSAIYYYYIRGTVQDHDEYSRLVGLVERLMPKHLEPIYQVSILSDNAIARAGLAITGRARLGVAS